MLNYQPIEVLKSVLYHCNTLSTNHHSSYVSHMIYYGSSNNAALPQET